MTPTYWHLKRESKNALAQLPDNGPRTAKMKGGASAARFLSAPIQQTKAMSLIEPTIAIRQ
jgi:hypothetical protein